MGRYKNSTLHKEFSDFHYRLVDQWDIGDKMLLSDIDRIWMPIEYGAEVSRPICVIDLKKPQDELSFKEKQIYEWFNRMGIPVYILTIISVTPVDMIVATYPKGKPFHLRSEEEFARWELQIRGIPESEMTNSSVFRKRNKEREEFIASARG